MGMGDLFKAVRKLVPDAKYGSVAAELLKMKGAGLLRVTGRGDTGNLYGLTTEGSASAAAN
jgi:hypothetical protein